jgi:glyoxylase I family protein
LAAPQPSGPQQIDHLDLVVSSIERSLPFYRDLLKPLGFERVREVEGEEGETIHYISGPGACALGLRQKQSEAHGVPFDRYAVGVHHVAFLAPSRGAVDQSARWLAAHGIEIESEPREYDYRPGYYAVFFYDPDGIKLEIVHIPQ